VKDEEPAGSALKISYPDEKYIHIQNMTFSYPGTSENVLDDVSFSIPYGKTTAIVGASGSGKTTLLKLLLRFYDNYEGSIGLGETSLKEVSHKFWRGKCGTVLQDGFIFSDTVENNICIGEENADEDRLNNAVKLANIESFVKGLPLGYKTKIGAEGMGISQGQKQRLLIARAIYKNPDYLFFDEATNALDANNESVITKNLEQFFKNKTVVVVAHRLSTVKNADQIIVLDNGRVIEFGTHRSLVSLKSAYYTLVKNQLELGN
jgi:ATP-binding cassette subfamily B protein